jgi:hypothetical protein
VIRTEHLTSRDRAKLASWLTDGTGAYLLGSALGAIYTVFETVEGGGVDIKIETDEAATMALVNDPLNLRGFGDVPLIPPDTTTWRFKVEAVTYCADLERHNALKAIWDACQEAGVRPPGEVRRYFSNGAHEVPQDVVEDVRYQTHQIYGYDVIEVQVKDIPEGARTIQFRMID